MGQVLVFTEKKAANVSVLMFLCRCRSRWLKEPDADSNELFRMVAEIFILWCKSHVCSFISSSHILNSEKNRRALLIGLYYISCLSPEFQKRGAELCGSK